MNTPTRTVALLQQALAHHQAGRLEHARPLYEQVVRLEPRNFDAAHLSGVLAYQQKRYDEAERRLVLALRLNPRSAVAEMRLALVLLARQQAAAAEARLQRLTARPDAPPEAWIHLSRALLLLGRRPDALTAAQTAVRLLPDSGDAHRVLATCMVETQGFAAAVPALRRMTELAPEDPLNWADLGIALAWQGALAEAEQALHEALRRQPGLTQAEVGLGFAYQQAHRIPEAVAAYARALAREPAHAQAQSARLLCLHYLDEPAREEIFAAHVAFGQTVGSAGPMAPGPRAGSSTKRLRVAFLSADFRRHSVAYFIEPILRHLDRSRFEIVLYHDHHQVDGMSERLKALADHWAPVGGFTAAQLEARLASDAPDVLVDLAGHTGFNRLPLLGRRLAPVQVTYLGYPDTTGLAAMDFRFVDAVTDPEGDADRFHTEKLVRFAPTAWAYEPPVEAPDVAPPPSLAGGPITFGSFNTFSKISDQTLRLWSRVLGSLPGSRLLLKGHGLDDAFVQAPLQARLTRCGLDPGRVDLLGRTQGIAAHLALYARMDVALDPLPYSGTTTTCEALWMGRPVVTLAGDRHARRVSASLLQAIGHPEWAASDEDQYLERALTLARDPERLQATGRQLRTEMRRSVLCDHPGQAARFGEALERCWREKTGAGAPATET